MGSVDTWVGYWGRLRPGRAAVAAGGCAVTWGALADRSGRLAAGLAAEGAGRGRRIGVRSRDPIRVIEVIAACARLGAVAVPLDPARDQDRLRRIVARAGLFALLTSDDQVGGEEKGAAAAAAGMDEPLLLLHSRGTTGEPKAAVLTHGNVEAVAVAAIAADGLVPADRVGIDLGLAATPAGLAATLGALHAGALIRFGDPAELLGDDDRPTVLVTTCEQLGRPGVLERLGGGGTRGPRLVKAPGPVAGAVRGECRTRAIPFVEMYGLAETGGLILQASPFLAADGLRPLLGQRARVAGGELVVAGSAVSGGGWLRTGDLAVEGQDGSLTIVGRRA